MANKPVRKIYEVSFHSVPTLSEEEAREVYAGVRTAIAGNGEVLGTDEPKKIPLAYTIRHHERRSDGSYTRYDEAYFSSVKCAVSQEYAAGLQERLRGDGNIIRFLVTETVAEDTRVAPAEEKAADGEQEHSK